MNNEIKQIESKFKEEKELNLTFLIESSSEEAENEKKWYKENPDAVYGLTNTTLQKIYDHYNDVYKSRNKLFDGLSKIPASGNAYFYTGVCYNDKFQTLIKLKEFKTVWITHENEMEQAKLNTKYSMEYYKMSEKKED